MCVCVCVCGMYVCDACFCVCVVCFLCVYVLCICVSVLVLWCSNLWVWLYLRFVCGYLCEIVCSVVCVFNYILLIFLQHAPLYCVILYAMFNLFTFIFICFVCFFSFFFEFFSLIYIWLNFLEVIFLTKFFNFLIFFHKFTFPHWPFPSSRFVGCYFSLTFPSISQSYRKWSVICSPCSLEYSVDWVNLDLSSHVLVFPCAIRIAVCFMISWVKHI